MMRKERFFKATNWDQMSDRIDKSAWSRLNDFIWEPERVPVREDKAEFKQLAPNIQEALLRTYGALAYSSTLQMQTGIESIKADALTPEEVGVLNALQYLESINNKSFSYLLTELAGSDKTQEIFKWADANPYLQTKIHTLNQVYQTGNPLQKRAAHVILETALYHSGFFATLYLFGQKKLPRTTEVIKLVIRSTSFNGMYPGYKYRLALSKCSQQEQERMHQWVLDFIHQAVANEEKHIELMYAGTDWSELAKHYVYYSINKALLNLGYTGIYPDEADSIDPTLEEGVIKSAVFEDFFYYANSNSLTKFNELK